MSPFTFRLIQSLIILVIVVLLGTGVVFFLRYDSGIEVGDAQIQATLLRLQSSAFVYHGRLGYFDGVCSDIGLPKNYVCRETEKSFIIYVQLSDGSWYCADSTNYIGREVSVGTNNSSCPQ